LGAGVIGDGGRGNPMLWEGKKQKTGNTKIGACLQQTKPIHLKKKGRYKKIDRMGMRRVKVKKRGKRERIEPYAFSEVSSE